MVHRNLKKELDAGKFLTEINKKFKLTTIKPLHLQWIIDVYNQLCSFEGKKLLGWMESFRYIRYLDKRFAWIFWWFH